MPEKRTKKKSTRRKKTTTRKPAANGRVSMGGDPPTAKQVREAREVLEQAASIYAADMSSCDQIRQVDLAVVRELTIVAGAVKSFGETWKEVALGFRQRVMDRAAALADDPLDEYDDTPIEPGAFALSYKETAGRSSMSWRDKAKALWRELNGKPEPSKNMDAEAAKNEPSEKWATAETKKAPKGDPSYTPQIEIRG